MIVKPNMGLVVWTSINDYFSHVQLAANFEALDEHNHTSGKGVKIPAGGIAEQAVEYNNLANGVVEALTTNVKNNIALPINKTLWQETAVTRTSTAYGSFSATPLRLELGKVKPNQMIELKGSAFVKNTVESSSATIGGFVNLVISSASHIIEAPSPLFTLNGSALAANTNIPLLLVTGGPAVAFGKATEANISRTALNVVGNNLTGMIWPYAEETVTVEIQGKASSGTLTAEKVFMNARVY